MASYARGCAMLCQKTRFWAFLADVDAQHGPVTSREDAAQRVRALLNVDSRRELDTDPAAAERYRALIRRLNEWGNSLSNRGVSDGTQVSQG